MGLADGFIAIPWRQGGIGRDGADCRGLVQLVLDAHLPGVRLPDGDDASDWHRVDAPRPLDVVVMMRPVTVNLKTLLAPLHVGIMVSVSQMLHMPEGGRSEAPHIAAPHIRAFVEGFYRHSSMMDA